MLGHGLLRSDRQVKELEEACSKAQDSDWKAAAVLCRKALELLERAPGDPRLAHATEFLARSLYRLAFQSETREAFEQALKDSKVQYDRAALLHDDPGRSKRSSSKSMFASFWLVHDSEERSRILERCISTAGEAAEFFKERGERRELGRTYNDLLEYLPQALDTGTEWDPLSRQLEEALKTGRDALSIFESLGEDMEFIRSARLTVLLASKAESIVEPKTFEELSEYAIELGRKARETVERIGTPRARSLADETSACIAHDFEGDLPKALSLYQRSLTANVSNDRLVLGRVYWAMSAAAYWLGSREEYVEKRRDLFDKALGYASTAIDNLKVPMHTSYLAAAHSIYAESCINLATLVEIEAVKKKQLLRKAVETAERGTAYESGTWAWRQAAHTLAKAMYFSAGIEDDPNEKKQLLNDSLPVREETVRVTDRLFPHSWSCGATRNYLALIKAELARTEQDPDTRARLLKGATSDMQQCLDLCAKWTSVPGFTEPIARYEEWYGDILFQLYQLTSEVASARDAVKAYQEAMAYTTRSRQVTHLGPLRWKTGKVYDALGEFKEASDAFTKAAEDYKHAATKIPGTAPAFHELASYMEAWVEIEKARSCHAEEQYDQSHESYARAVKLLQATRSWSRLSMLCDALSLLEKGEALSHEEKHGAAVESLRKALDSFRRAKEEMEKMVRTATDLWEKCEIEDWLKIAEQREAYARGRIELEEARSLDRNGEKVASSRKYNSASEAFKTLAARIAAPRERGEMLTLAKFCESWARMKEADSKASPELFAGAAESFRSIEENTTNQSLRLLALGNAAICRALEHGTRFRQSRNVQLYSEIKRQLEIAGDHYTEAGLKKTGTWTRATQRLFDALVLLTDAEVERDIRKKTELYHMAEKHLELAAKLYGEAGFPSRKRETLEQLEKTREEKEVLLAPLEALAEIPTASGAHLPPIPLRGVQALGLERFEDAKVAGEVRTAQSELTVGSDFTIEMDIANVGKTPATLIKLENVIPKGCKPISNESYPGLEGDSLDLRGKRLEYLKTHKVKLSLRATGKEAFELSPRVVYVDEKGNYRSTSLQPLFFTIREPGVSEGMQAPHAVHVPQEFRFGNERSREVFQHLVKEFLDDYMTRRVFVEKAGWRSMMDLVREMKIPRSTLYGPGGRAGPVLAELERRGLVETRVFPGERGRGGEIKKVRVAYENSIVKRIVEKAAMQNA